MFQSFDEVSTPEVVPERLRALRRELKSRKLKGFLVPHSDEHQDEFLPPSAERLRWLTGFTGSAGAAIVLENAAALFVDGRYTLQAQAQTDTSLIEVLQTPEAKASKWLTAKLPKGGTVGYDPSLHTIKEIERLTESLGKAGIRLEPQATNPIDLLWQDRPAPSTAPVIAHGLEFAGRSAAEKITEVQEILKREKADAVLITLLDSIAWLFNIRGADINHSPLALAFALVPARGKPSLFIDCAKVGNNVRGHLKDVVELLAPDALDVSLNALGQKGARVRLDPETTPVRFKQVLEASGAKTVAGEDPCILPKAIKNAAEIKGARAAHLRDGVALVSFLAWLDEHSPSGRVDEIIAAMKLEEFRRETGELKDISFDSISASGMHGAVVHYRPTTASNLKLKPRSLYLVDSGGQYADGTTDITRTIAIGAATTTMRRHYTLLLKAHIAIASARFPKGTRGQDIDPFARRPLWEAGLDFDHGTGHGVGSYLSVHEPPQRISRHGTVELQPGMILSNEPGLYREGEYGIRLENLVLVTPPAPIKGGTREMLGFETLTLVPFDRRLIDPGLLTLDELAWLNAYHAEVRRKIEPLLKGADRSWLREATAPIR
ncbi:MAG TPA: aminopeptidase P family protein [Methyloceanibacter sp.]|jgi:Xaa-Pro aminopeptidase|nr:aminopeptidase P family protein [Methyloceanibacter sp.]